MSEEQTPVSDPFVGYADELLERAAHAALELRTWDQPRIDGLIEAMAAAAFDARIELARLAHEETGMGVFEHKVQKNAWASLVVAQDLRGRRTVGLRRDDRAAGITEYLEPLGPILALTPVTNPTSTVIFKVLSALKARNPLIFSFHRGARKCSKEAARVMYDAALAYGAPEYSLQWIVKPQIEFVDRVMRHPKLALILATGTPGIVRTAMTTGKPTLGVGPGNVPVYVHASADLAEAARLILHSKTFDNGTVCASEQTLIVERDVAAALRPLFDARGGYFCTPEQTAALGLIAFDPEKRSMRAEVVGRPAGAIAELAGFSVPERTRLLIAPIPRVDREQPLAHEILAPILAWYEATDYADALDACAITLKLGGIGHTVGIHARSEVVISDASILDAARILINTPTTDGAVGGIWNQLRPSLSLATGPAADNLLAENITVDHLLQVRRIARPHPNRAFLDQPRERWLDESLEYPCLGS
ncbi:MAG: aldehyde dehydrogenase family protein [Candidatus Eisenbacteria bacterium]|nr:aldehyde dehydrogenase family protein [Candidatus Eisenbacteria bacterium]